MSESFGVPAAAAPQHLLYFFPDPHGQGSLRPSDIGGKGGVGADRRQRGSTTEPTGEAAAFSLSPPKRHNAVLASTRHVEQWRRRSGESALEEIVNDTSWHRNESGTLGVARAIYLRLPTGFQLWDRDREFGPGAFAASFPAPRK